MIHKINDKNQIYAHVPNDRPDHFDVFATDIIWKLNNTLYNAKYYNIEDITCKLEYEYGTARFDIDTGRIPYTYIYSLSQVNSDLKPDMKKEDLDVLENMYVHQICDAFFDCYSLCAPNSANLIVFDETTYLCLNDKDTICKLFHSRDFLHDR